MKVQTSDGPWEYHDLVKFSRLLPGRALIIAQDMNRPDPIIHIALQGATEEEVLWELKKAGRQVEKLPN